MFSLTDEFEEKTPTNDSSRPVPRKCDRSFHLRPYDAVKIGVTVLQRADGPGKHEDAQCQRKDELDTYTICAELMFDETANSKIWNTMMSGDLFRGHL